MMGETVTQNMYSKAIANKKRNCCILLDLFHHYTHPYYNIYMIINVERFSFFNLVLSSPQPFKFGYKFAWLIN